LVESLRRVTMCLFVRGYCTVIAASVQCDVDGIPKRSHYPDDGEGPVRRVQVEPFRVDTRAVSNADYARFVDASANVTEAERFGWSFVFGGLLPDDFPPTRGVAHAPWWRQVEGADWRRPEGPQSDIGGRDDHPVVHVSWNDAQSYSV
jgi:sulfatase modifying factor 1